MINSKDFHVGENKDFVPFISNSWQQEFELIAHLTQYSQNILLVVGPEKVGKTTFLNEFLELKTPKLRKHTIKANGLYTVEQLMKEVAISFNLIWPKDAKLENIPLLLQNQFQFLAENNHLTSSLLVDDAHLLNDACISALLGLVKFNISPNLSLHLILFGDSNFEKRLLNQPFNLSVQGKIHATELSPWTQEEMDSFVLEKIPKFAQQLTPALKLQILQNTNGCPGKVIQALNKFFASFQQPPKNKEDKRKFFWSKLFSRPIALGAYLGIAVGLTFLLWNLSDDEVQAVPFNSAQVESQPTLALNAATNEEEVIDAFEIDLALNELEQNMAQTQEQFNQSQVKLVEIQDLKIPLQEREEPKIEIAKVEVNTEKEQVIEKIKEEIAPKAKPKSVVKKLEPNIIKAQLAKFSSEEEELLAKDKSHYTVQLLGASSEKNVKAFIKDNKLQSQAYCFRSKLKGKDWYVLVYGDYKTTEDAREALKDLKEKGADPWVRPIKSVQATIEKNQKS